MKCKKCNSRISFAGNIKLIMGFSVKCDTCSTENKQSVLPKLIVNTIIIVAMMLFIVMNEMRSFFHVTIVVTLTIIAMSVLSLLIPINSND